MTRSRVKNDFSIGIDDGADATAITIDSSENVGIGITSSIAAELHVKGTSTVAKFEGTGGSGFISIADSDDGTIGFIGVDAGKLKFQTSGSSYSDKLVIDTAGKIGIGIDDPSQRLQIKSSEAQTNLSIWNSGTADNSRYAQLLLTHGSTFFGANDKSWQLVSEGQTGGTTQFKIQSWNGSAYNLNATFFEDGNVNMNNGVRFGGDTATANTLDDYEEGSWTPTTVQGGSVNNIDTGNCRYTKIGNTVHVRGEFWNFSSTSSSALIMGGLPYTVANGVESAFPVMYHQVNLDSGYTQLTGYAQPNSNNFRFYESGDAASWSAVRGDQCGSSTDFILAITYEAA